MAEVKITGACRACGDSLQTVPVTVPDHSSRRRVWIGWCMDCQIPDSYLIEVEHGERRTIGENSAIPATLVSFGPVTRFAGLDPLPEDE